MLSLKVKEILRYGLDGSYFISGGKERKRETKVRGLALYRDCQPKPSPPIRLPRLLLSLLAASPNLSPDRPL